MLFDLCLRSSSGGGEDGHDTRPARFGLAGAAQIKPGIVYDLFGRTVELTGLPGGAARQDGRFLHIPARCSAPSVQTSTVRPNGYDPPAFTASRKGLPALNVGAVEAAMFRLSPALGLRPARAGRLLAPKVPKPAARTSSPLARASAIASNTASTASQATDLPTPVRSATWPAISDLFTR